MEMIVVVLIVGLVTAVALSGARRQPRPLLAEAGRALLALAETCRSGASLFGAPRAIVYDLSAQRAWIEIPDEEDPDAPPKRILETTWPAPILLKAIHLDERNVIETGTVRLTATPAGFLPPHLAHLTVAGADLERTVAVAPFPGQGRVFDGPPDWEETFRSETEDDRVEGVKALVDE